MKNSTRLSIGSEFEFETTKYIVESFAGSIIVARSGKGEVLRIGIRELATSESYKSKDENISNEPLFVEGLSKSDEREAKALAEELLEAITGYRSGTPSDALTTEPRIEYDPTKTTLNSRFDAKAKELNVSSRTLWYQKKSYEERGINGLVDHRKFRIGTAKLDSRIQKVIIQILDDLTEESNTSKQRIRRLVEEELDKKFPDDNIKLPSEATFNRRLNELAKGRSQFGPAKQRRSIANRPDKPYSHFTATRPGEMVLIDSTPLDVYAMDPYSFQWIPVELTIAIDLFTRSIVGWRFTPVSTKSVDAAFLLADIIKPKYKSYEWNKNSEWSYIGIPENIIIEVEGDSTGIPLAAIPFLHPESVIVDRGRVFLSEAFSNACRYLGINLYIARPYTPTDKAHVERIFKTIRESFLLNLDGYKGPDVWSRGKEVTESSFWFLDEIDMKFGEWVATYWQKRHHDGLSLPNIPDLHICPNQMFEEGVARAGFLYVPNDKNLYYELLPTAWRTIQHYGIGYENLNYDGDILNDYRDKKSHYTQMNGKWPLRYDPRDRSFIAFYDHNFNRWHELKWTGMGPTHRPFNEMTISYAKSLILDNGGNINNKKELEKTLHTILNRIDEQQTLGRKERKLAAVNMINAAASARDKPSIAAPYLPDAEMKEIASDPFYHMPVAGRNSDSDENHPIIPESTFRIVDDVQDDDDIF